VLSKEKTNMFTKNNLTTDYINDLDLDLEMKLKEDQHIKLDINTALKMSKKRTYYYSKIERDLKRSYQIERHQVGS